jgi:sec-independent protein translocase protein TatA
MPGFIGIPELMLLGLVVLLVFGPKRLPEMGRSMGRGLREFKASVTGEDKNQEPLDLGELEAVEEPVAVITPIDEPVAVAVPAERQRTAVR